MKTVIRLKTTTVLLLAALTIAGCAGISSPVNLRMAVQSAIPGSGTVMVNVYNGVATLSGYVDDKIAKFAVERAARKVDGVNDVINLISTAG
jgi:osmotically-inducible protein OsmY